MGKTGLFTTKCKAGFRAPDLTQLNRLSGVGSGALNTFTTQFNSSQVTQLVGEEFLLVFNIAEDFYLS